MKIPIEWLKEFVTIRLSPGALAERLTMAGLEVVAIDEVDGQSVFDIEVTPNRADCLSILGIAREVAVVTGQRLKLPHTAHGRQPTGKTHRASTVHRPPSTNQLVIRIEDHQGCSRYIGRLIDGVRVGASPEWMQRRLIACGARPINVLVDITNYVLFEYGQPLHAFDSDRIAGGTVLVRRAKPNESLRTLDGITRALSSETLVIADAAQAMAVAGIMGGTDSAVTPQTQRVLLESARFDPIAIRRAARRLGLASESSYRFERGVDPVGVETASARAAALMAELAGGAETACVDAGATPSKRAVIALEPERLARWLGAPVAPSTIRTTLARLSCHVASSPTARVWQVAVPSFRADLRHPVDLYEELARIAGYDTLPSTMPVVPLVSQRVSGVDAYERAQALRRCCASLGLSEVITWSLIAEADLARWGYSVTGTARLSNPISQDHAFVRPSLLSGMMQAVRRNLTQGAAGVQVFELGHVFDGAAERTSLGIVLAGMWTRDWRGQETCDFFRLKGILHALMGRLCDGTLSIRAAERPWAEQRQAAQLLLNGRVLGVLGQVSRAITEAQDIAPDVWAAEIDAIELLAHPRRPTIRPPSMMPPVKRDLSVLVGTSIPFERVAQAIQEAGAPLAGRIELIDRYAGPQIPSGHVSLTFSIEYRDPARTLTATEVDAIHQRIGESLVRHLSAALR